MQLPATTLKDAFNACDPTQALPAGDRRYVDLTLGRGESGLDLEDTEPPDVLLALVRNLDQNQDRWCDVHPVARRLPEFLEARTALRRSA